MYICDKSFNSETFFHYKESGLPWQEKKVCSI
jgi:hypothetical protein